ncbi:MAG: bifunctional alpha/beta hydrolase/class I SAM-dependent methyltransferase [Cohaesibacteraceae bacterium]|nr:bifunctional alpha/beta hydrolase/class I SAM-dependent methyltransferase [Cohaesibacteraceae bacterium]
MKIEEKHFTSHDGIELFYRHWRPETRDNKAIILFHRGHEHSGRWHDVIEKLNLPGFDIFAWDARGHGKSPGERGYANDFGTLVQDVDQFVAHVSSTSGIPYENIVIFAHSVGSVLVSTWVHDYAPPIRGLVLGSPALRVRLYLPFAISGLRILQKIRKKTYISSYVKGHLLTRDPEKAHSYDTDPLITPKIAVNILLGLHDAATRLINDAGAITVPTLILSSGADFVVEQGVQKKFYDRLSSPRREMQTFVGFRHDTFNELDNHLPIGKARMFIEDLFDRNVEQVDLTGTDGASHTKIEHDALLSPLAWWSPKNWNFSLTRILMKTVGRISQGITLGWKTGFDSGSMLDYVYENKARGISPFGKLVDRAYLDSPGWKGIRQRKVNLETFLHSAIKNRLDEGEQVRVLDIATGHGRYVLDVLAQFKNQDLTAVLRDYSDINVIAGRKLAASLKLSNVTYSQGDAFDQLSLDQIDTNPNIAIVSGLYELFSNNDEVATSLAGVYAAMARGGTLIYTNQPWHPQLECIARVLSSHRGGDDWVMRRRTQQEMDQLVAKAGFEKLDQKIDEDGIFSVSIAIKPVPTRQAPATKKAGAKTA